MDALEWLQQHLQPQHPDPALGAGLPGALQQLLGHLSAPAPAGLPSGLPEAVRRSILTQPSYGEGQITAPGQWYNPTLNEESRLQPGPLREERLMRDLYMKREFLRNYDMPMPEGAFPSWNEPGQSSFAAARAAGAVLGQAIEHHGGKGKASDMVRQELRGFWLPHQSIHHLTHQSGAEIGLTSYDTNPHCSGFDAPMGPRVARRR